jgi:cobalt-zinc-cadmium efflux system protein
MPLDHERHDHGHDHGHGHGHDHGDRHGHGHGHPHGHSHHGHHHGPARYDGAFAIGITLNGALVAAQIAVGLLAGSMALLADAVHNLGDVLGLLLAWGAIVLGRRAPSAARTYGWGRSTILASLANAMLLLVSIGAIGIEALRRLAHPAPVDGKLVAIVAGLGLLVNGATALLFMRGRESDLNVRGAFLHMASDAAISAGVLVAALVITQTDWLWLDPAVSLGISAIIGAGTWGLLRESMNLAMDAVPAGMDLAEIETFLRTLPCVHEVHDLHVWALSTTENAVTAHLVQHGTETDATLIPSAVAGLRDRFGIGHATIQVETLVIAEGCGLRAQSVV